MSAETPAFQPSHCVVSAVELAEFPRLVPAPIPHDQSYEDCPITPLPQGYKPWIVRSEPGDFEFNFGGNEFHPGWENGTVAMMMYPMSPTYGVEVNLRKVGHKWYYESK